MNTLPFRQSFNTRYSVSAGYVTKLSRGFSSIDKSTIQAKKLLIPKGFDSSKFEKLISQEPGIKEYELTWRKQNPEALLHQLPNTVHAETLYLIKNLLPHYTNTKRVDFELFAITHSNNASAEIRNFHADPLLASLILGISVGNVPAYGKTDVIFQTTINGHRYKIPLFTRQPDEFCIIPQSLNHTNYGLLSSFASACHLHRIQDYLYQHNCRINIDNISQLRGVVLHKATIDKVPAYTLSLGINRIIEEK